MSKFTFTRIPRTLTPQGGPERCPFIVDNPCMTHRWSDLTFLHYRYPTKEIQKLLPDGLVAEEIDSSGWVSVVPFRMNVKLAYAGKIFFPRSFPETNVRTYVTDANGERGIWFFSLDAQSLIAVSGGRIGYGLDYFWSTMKIVKDDSCISYTSQRRYPHTRISHTTSINVGDPYRADELNDIDHMLSAQWKLFSYQHGQLKCAYASHEPWVLHHAHVIQTEHELLRVAGLIAPKEPPIAQYSPGVDVQISLPSRVT